MAAPLWLLFLFTGILISLQAQFIRPEYFPKTFTLYPQWPAQDPVRAAYVFAGTMGLLLVPKLLGYLAMLPDRATRRGFGGAAPRVHQHARRDRHLGADRAGDDADPVDRRSSGILMRARQRLAGAAARRRQPAACATAMRRYGWHTAFGLLLALAAYEVSFSLFAWMTPVIVGLILAIPLAQWSASAAAGRRMRRHKLLLTPEESEPPQILERANALALEFRRRRFPRTRSRGCSPIPPCSLRIARCCRRALRASAAMVDTALVIGLAKLEDCTTLTEAADDADPRREDGGPVGCARARSPRVTTAIGLPSSKGAG